eukprot:354575-Chlamydomonas_euryale.AAC.2
MQCHAWCKLRHATPHQTTPHHTTPHHTTPHHTTPHHTTPHHTTPHHTTPHHTKPHHTTPRHPVHATPCQPARRVKCSAPSPRVGMIVLLAISKQLRNQLAPQCSSPTGAAHSPSQSHVMASSGEARDSEALPPTHTPTAAPPRHAPPGRQERAGRCGHPGGSATPGGLPSFSALRQSAFGGSGQGGGRWVGRYAAFHVLACGPLRI